MSGYPFKYSDLNLDPVKVTQAVFSIDEGNVSVTLPRSPLSLGVPCNMFSRGSMVLDLTIENLDNEEKCLKPHKTTVSSCPRYSEIASPLLWSFMYAFLRRKWFVAP
jgi:hypothetical protein